MKEDLEIKPFMQMLAQRRMKLSEQWAIFETSYSAGCTHAMYNKLAIKTNHKLEITMLNAY